MVKIKIDKTYSIPSSWHDITCGKFREWLMLDTTGDDEDVFFRKLSFATGISIETLEQCDFEAVTKLKQITSFLYQPELLDAFNFYDKQYDSLDVGTMPAKVILKVQGALGKVKGQDGVTAFLCAGNEIVEAYTGKDITGEPITAWYGIMGFFLSKSVGFSLNTAFSTLTNQAKTKSKQV
jgi:hypothetical protein